MTPDHTSRELLELLHGATVSADCPLTDAWRAAEAEAQLAYDVWRAAPEVDAYVAYMAAEERAAAAQEELARWTDAREASTARRAMAVAV
ncbi:MAG: hypothetical protein JWQ20_3857 [Conexibacter sp.]|nr:hypothetical protein [Conexibacter sp.]